MTSVRSIVIASAVASLTFLTALDARAASGDDAELARSARPRDHPARRARAEPGGRREPGARPGRRGAKPGRLAPARPRGQVRAVGRAARAPVRAQRGEHADAGRAPDVPRLGHAGGARARGGRGRGERRRTPRARAARKSPPRCGAPTRAYYGADQELRLHLEHVGLTSRILELARLNQRTGHGSLQDVLRLELELTRLHTDVARVERQQRSSRALLNALMDRPSDAPLGPPEDLSVTPTTDITALASGIDTNRPEVVAAAPRRAPQRGAARRSAPGGPVPDRHGRPRLLVHADVPRLPARLWGDGRHQPAVAVGAPSRRRAGGGADGPGRAARARVHEEHRPLRAARRGRAGGFGAPVVHDHRPGPARPGEARASKRRRPRTPPARATRSALLDALRSYLQVRIERVQALAELASSQADLERAAGTLAVEGGSDEHAKNVDDERRQTTDGRGPAPRRRRRCRSCAGCWSR